MSAQLRMALDGRRFRAAEHETRDYLVVVRGDPCAYCGERCEVAGDHIDAFSLDGHLRWWNLTAACLECNSSKHTTPLLMFLLTSRRLRRLAQMRLFDDAAA